MRFATARFPNDPEIPQFVRLQTHTHQLKVMSTATTGSKPVADTESALKRTGKVAKLHVMATCFSRFSVSDAGFEPALVMPQP